MIGQSLESIMIQLHCNNSIKPEKMEEIIHALKSALPFCSLLPIFKDQDDRKCRIFIRMLPLYSKGNALHALVTIEKQAADQSSFPSFQFSELPLSLQYEAHLQSGSSHSDSTHSPTASHTTREEETDSTSQHSKMVVHKPIPNRASNSSPLTMASQMMHNDNAIDSNLGVEEEDTDLMHFNQQNTSEEFLFGLLNDFNKDNNNQDLDSMVIDLDQPSFR